MPLLVHPMRRGRSECMVLPQSMPRLADGEVGDVDHLLHLAVAFSLDLAVFERDERAERVLALAQQEPEAPRPRRAFGAGTSRHARAAATALASTAS